jgi:hypothetical protein
MYIYFLVYLLIICRAWNRIKSALSFGDCLLTIATGPSILPSESGDLKVGLTSFDEELTGLVPGHAYAVLDVKEIAELRLLKV